MGVTKVRGTKWPVFKLGHVGKWTWHLHHGILVERVNSKGIMDRINYIVDDKPSDQVDLRCQLIKICKQQRRLNKLYDMWASDHYAFKKVKAEIMRMHRKECKFNCPFVRDKEDSRPYEGSDDFSPQGDILTRYRYGTGNQASMYVLRGQGGRIFK